jgi:hypothetical protein
MVNIGLHQRGSFHFTMLSLTFLVLSWVWLCFGVFGFTVSAFYAVRKQRGPREMILIDKNVKLILDDIEKSAVVPDKCVCC